ncbi:Smr/MutS family protein [Lacrimispora sp. NSJ-141]|uniref:Smr/MutS family protein n=1 Tax=Lientehia hominis TaxID=2897778 RepID=A0AAP2RKS5_9FIRM|nr:Smr/MutS family protein [Lientehia hominis]MCD2493580.1 Smr/MutS family protein [Lientehia hominis]
MAGLSMGIVEVDIHGMNRFQAKNLIAGRLKRAGGDIYRIRVIHGYHNGTSLKDMVRKEFRGHPKVLRVEVAMNPGETDLVLREF